MFIREVKRLMCELRRNTCRKDVMGAVSWKEKKIYLLYFLFNCQPLEFTFGGEHEKKPTSSDKVVFRGLWGVRGSLCGKLGRFILHINVCAFILFVLVYYGSPLVTALTATILPGFRNHMLKSISTYEHSHINA